MKHGWDTDQPECLAPWIECRFRPLVSDCKAVRRTNRKRINLWSIRGFD